MTPYTTILQETEEHVTEMFTKHHPHNLVLHNFSHTASVVKRVKEIAAHYQLNEEDKLVVTVAAWFHDTGYLFVPPKEHERKSADLAKDFMKDFDLPAGTVDRTENCIMATREPRAPHNLVEEMLCDADTYQFGAGKGFKISDKLAFEEAQHLSGLTISKKTFDEGTMRMLQEHTFYTTYCRDLLNEGKKENIKKIKSD